MKNKEKYAEDIIALAICGFNIACYKKTKELVACETLDCEKCMFNSDGNCTAFRRSWFESEVELTVEDELKSELETVKKERDELRARLKRAVELPCELGSPLYIIDETRDTDSWELNPCVTHKYCAAEVTVCENGDFLFQVETSTSHKRLRFGEDIFTTRAEAEARLKELQEGEKGE